MGRADLALMQRLVIRVRSSKRQTWTKPEIMEVFFDEFMAHVEKGREIAKKRYGDNGGLDKPAVENVTNEFPRGFRNYKQI